MLSVPGATGDYATDLDRKAEVATTMLEGSAYDFGFVHIKAVDDASHDGLFDLKVHFLERIDSMVHGMVSRLGALDNGHAYLLVVTGDHSTPVKLAEHSYEPVPFLIAPIKCVSLNTCTVARSAAALPSFDEVSCAAGPLGRFTGQA